MALVHRAKREINAKIVYFGPERAGKSSALRYLFDRIRPALRGTLKNVSLGGSSLLFFDFSPFEHAVFGDFRIRLHIHTLQGRVANPAAWKMTLKGLDGLVFVVDSAREDYSAARQSLSLLRDTLGVYGMGLDDIPLVLQCNMPDCPVQVPVEEVANALGLGGRPAFPTITGSGSGVLDAIACLSRLVLARIGERSDLSSTAEALAVELPAAATAADGFQLDRLAGAAGDSGPSDSPAAVFPPDEAQRKVVIAEEGLTIEGGTVRIPLEVEADGGVRRLVVTVSVAAG